jgi:hypothetical protein
VWLAVWQVMVFVKDTRLGRRALLWWSGKTRLRMGNPLNDFATFLPPHSRSVSSRQPEPLVSPHGRDLLTASVAFHVRPVGSHEGVEERDKLWVVAGGDPAEYAQHDSACMITFDTGEHGSVGGLIRSLLQG